MAAFLEIATVGTTKLEPAVAVTVCEGCNGSKCGSDPHQYRKARPTISVVTKIIRAKEVDPGA